MTVRELLSEGKAILKVVSDIDCSLDSRLLMALALSCSREQLLARMNHHPDMKQRATFLKLCHTRAQGTPLAYMTGTKEFYAREFKVDPRVLIPRPDTEILVEQALDWIMKIPKSNPLPKAKSNSVFDSSFPDMPPDTLRIVDCCTGSGCIGITLALELKDSGVPCRVLCTDISQAALELAQENAVHLGINECVSFLQADLLSPMMDCAESIHILCANPPYLTSLEAENPAVKAWGEPHQAFDGGTDGLDPYRRLIPQAYKLLCSGGMVFLELGSSQAEQVLHYLRQEEYSDTRCFKDLAGLDRVVTGRK